MTELAGAEPISHAMSAHVGKTGHGWLDYAVALSAILISVISLLVAIDHGRNEERLLAASSWPFVTFGTEKRGLEAGGWTIYLNLRNSGIGPARIKWLHLTLDGRPVRSRADLMRRCCGITDGHLDKAIARGLVSDNDPTGVLPARDRVDILTWRPRHGNAATLRQLDDALGRLHAQACYCSVLGDCWTSNLTASGEPRQIAACAPIADGYDT